MEDGGAEIRPSLEAGAWPSLRILLLSSLKLVVQLGVRREVDVCVWCRKGRLVRHFPARRDRWIVGIETLGVRMLFDGLRASRSAFEMLSLISPPFSRTTSLSAHLGLSCHIPRTLII